MVTRVEMTWRLIVAMWLYIVAFVEVYAIIGSAPPFAQFLANAGLMLLGVPLDLAGYRYLRARWQARHERMWWDS